MASSVNSTATPSNSILVPGSKHATQRRVQQQCRLWCQRIKNGVSNNEGVPWKWSRPRLPAAVGIAALSQRHQSKRSRSNSEAPSLGPAKSQPEPVPPGRGRLESPPGIYREGPAPKAGSGPNQLRWPIRHMPKTKPHSGPWVNRKRIVSFEPTVHCGPKARIAATNHHFHPITLLRGHFGKDLGLVLEIVGHIGRRWGLSVRVVSGDPSGPSSEPNGLFR